ncbi:acetoin ABC transporter permease [Paenibacillus alvei]|uniref:acetoin ABC transporter permease n=1 Tax=Paenibacillus alvei TaxID=44250 RepID=UPI00227DE4D3|nr:acetoin ABC transporter permease [Paenibacillus alvei]MCY7485079.1 acetoin ABC transporter permease [Paenibacillus alvei]
MKHRLFVKALWWKEYRHTRVLLWLMLLASFMSIVYPHMRMLWFSTPKEKDAFVRFIKRYPDDVAWDLLRDYGGTMLLFLVFGGFLLSIWQLGYERRNYASEQVFALPYPRWLQYITKWMVGCTYIVFVVAIILALDIAIIKLSEIGEYVNVGSFIIRGLHMVFVAVSTFTFSMFIGSFTGSWTMQASLSIISLFLFEFFKMMLQQLLFIFMITPSYTTLKTRGTVWENFNISNWVLHENGKILFENGNYPYTVVAAISIVLFIIGTLFYSRNRLENNGKLIIFPFIEKAFILCFVLCALLLGGSIGYDALSPGRTGYIVGAALGGAIGYLIIRTLTHMRVRL